MDVVKFSLHKNPFIGLFFKASDKHVLLPSTLEGKAAAIFESTLKVTPIRLLVDHSRLLGVFTALNSSGCVLPSFAGEAEVKALKAHGLNVLKLDKFSPGTTILCNDFGVVVSPEFSRAAARNVADCLGVELIQTKVGSVNPIGLLNLVTNKGLLAYNNCSNEEIQKLKNFFKVKSADHATGNLGSAVGVSAVANSNGAVVGDLTSGFEVQRIYEVLSD